MTKRRTFPLLVSVVALLLASTASAQTCNVSLTDVPASVRNTRGSSDWLVVQRPGLTLNGFDCGDNCADGLGAKQVIERAFENPGDSKYDRPFNEMVNLYNRHEEYDALAFGEESVKRNSQHLQSYAFVALATYLLEKNGIDPTESEPCGIFALPPHHEAMDRLTDALGNPASWLIPNVGQPLSDAIKWVSTMQNIARAFDLYLALENAYAHYGDEDSARLFPSPQKTIVVTAYNQAIENFEAMASRLFILDGSPINPYTVQAGNWPMEVQTSIGYAALGAQSPGQIPSLEYPFRNQEQRFASWLRRAYTSAGERCTESRACHWAYNTDGRGHWAEGPYYFELTLDTMVSFWHAARLNGHLGNTSLADYYVTDPFRSDWFLDPVRWLAATATADGETLALDDGNRYPIRSASLLRWEGGYGDREVGEQFAYLDDASVDVIINGAQRRPDSFAKSPTTYLIELAIPRLSECPEDPHNGGCPDRAPPDVYGNTSAAPFTDQNETPLVVRRRASNGTHHVVLNGEAGAQLRGEGHEQADQLQLLYSIGGVSYLSDAGYDGVKLVLLDTPPGWKLSQFNQYDLHSVMNMIPVPSQNGGLPGPRWDWGRFRFATDHMLPVEKLHRSVSGNVDILAGQQTLQVSQIGLNGLFDAGRVHRRTLLIRDTDRPYLIDLNWAFHDPDTMDDPSMWGYHFQSQYRVNSAEAPEAIAEQDAQGRHARGMMYRNIQADRSPGGGDLFETNSSLLIQPYRVELPYRALNLETASRERNAGDADESQLLLIRSGDPRLTGEAEGVRFPDYQLQATVAFIEAFPDEANPRAGTLTDLAVPLTPDPGLWNANRERAYLWRRASDVIDVVAVRSAHTHTQRHAGSRSDYAFTVPDAGGVELTLPSNWDYGFVRLRRVGSDWLIQGGYQIGLRGPTEQIRSLSISGPRTVADEETHTWAANVNGGAAPFRYRWRYFYKRCTRGSSGGGSGGTINPRPLSEDNGSSAGLDVYLPCGWQDGGTSRRFTHAFEYSRQHHPTIRLSVGSAAGDWAHESLDLTTTPAGGSAKTGSETADGSEIGAEPHASAAGAPTEYALHGVRPNPARGAATVRYDVPQPGHVTLTVYDVLGRAVHVAVDETRPAGSHRQRLDTSGFAPGVYVVRIEASGDAGAFADAARFTVTR